MSKLKCAYLFRRDFDNPGDLYSCPVHYFFPDKSGIIIDVYDENLPDIEVDVVFIDGGAIFSTIKFINSVEQILTKVKSKYKIVWGVGLTSTLQDHITLNYDLFGTRDFNTTNFDWVPCSSVLHPMLFKNLNKIPSKKFLVVDHWKRPIEFMYEHTRLNNKPNNIHAVIEKIADHEYVFTSSYHVAYWATLLKRKTYVIGNELPAKFYTMKHSPTIESKFTDDLLDNFVIWETAFDECLEANKSFKQKVEELTGEKFAFVNPAFNL